MRESDTKATVPDVRETREDAETFAVQQLKAMEQPKWNEGRLDDLNKRVDDGIGRLDEERKELRGDMKDEFKSVRAEMREGFARVDREFKSVRAEMKEGFARVDREFKAVRSEMKSGFDRMQWTLLVAASGIIAALITAPHI